MQTWDLGYDWSTFERASTTAGDFCGVAIGPESDEGEIRVNGRLLQSGRVLPVHSGGSSYSISRPRVPHGKITQISRLQLWLFECPSEFAIPLVRPNAVYGASATVTSLATVITAPFSGRRHAMVEVGCSSVAALSGKLIGYRWNLLAAAAAPISYSGDSVTLVSFATGDFTGTTLAFHVGGTDSEECWDALVLQLASTGSSTVYADITTMGELGVTR